MAFGFVPRCVSGVGTATFTNGDATVVLNATDYTNCVVGGVIIIQYTDAYAAYYAYQIASKGTSPNIELTEVWVGTTGAYPVYFSGASGINSPRSMGSLLSVRFNLEAPHDTIGLPGQRFNKALSFDVEGNVMTIDIEGFWNDSKVCHQGHNYLLQSYAFTSNNCINNSSFFFWDGERLGDVGMKAYPVSVKKLESFRDVKDSSGTHFILHYKMSMVCRSPTP